MPSGNHANDGTAYGNAGQSSLWSVRFRQQYGARETGLFSQCLDVDVASQGSTEEEALDNLREALELHFEPPVASHRPAARQIEVEVGAAVAVDAGMLRIQ